MIVLKLLIVQEMWFFPPLFDNIGFFADSGIGRRGFRHGFIQPSIGNPDNCGSLLYFTRSISALESGRFPEISSNDLNSSPKVFLRFLQKTKL
jgi:hypothetical protein